MRRSGLPGEDEAAAVALRALAFLARDEQRLGRFLAVTGSDLHALRESARERAGQTAVLDYLLADETLLLIFVTEEAMPPELPRLARMRLAREDV